MLTPIIIRIILQKETMDRVLQMGSIKPRILLRFILLTIISMGFLLYRFFYKIQPTVCLNDTWHEFTAPLNQGLNHDGNDNVVIGLGQVIMDFWIVVMLIFWVVRLKNTRLGLAASSFFLVRTIMNEVMEFPFPDNLVWHNPGFFSLTVPYDRTRDFFYSGHTGSLTVITIECFTLGYRWLTILPLICLIYMMNMLLITRVHYTIDVAGGLVFAFFWSRFAERYISYFDWLLTFPYVLGRKVMERCRENKKRGNVRGNVLDASKHQLEAGMLGK